MLSALFTRMPFISYRVTVTLAPEVLFERGFHAFAVDVGGIDAGGSCFFQPTPHKRPEGKVSVGETGDGSFSGGREE